MREKEEEVTGREIFFKSFINSNGTVFETM